MAQNVEHCNASASSAFSCKTDSLVVDSDVLADEKQKCPHQKSQRQWKQLKKSLPWRGGVRLPPAGPSLLKVQHDWEGKLAHAGLYRDWLLQEPFCWERELWFRRNVPLIVERYNHAVLHFILCICLLVLVCFLGGSAFPALAAYAMEQGVCTGVWSGFLAQWAVTFFLLLVLCAFVVWVYQLVMLFTLQRDYRLAVDDDEKLGWKEKVCTSGSTTERAEDYGAMSIV